MEKRFKRYFFARIEQFIAENSNMQMKQSLYDLVRIQAQKMAFILNIYYPKMLRTKHYSIIMMNILKERETGLGDYCY